MRPSKEEILYEVLESERTVEIIYQDEDANSWTTLEIHPEIIRSFLAMLLIQEQDK